MRRRYHSGDKERKRSAHSCLNQHRLVCISYLDALDGLFGVKVILQIVSRDASARLYALVTLVQTLTWRCSREVITKCYVCSQQTKNLNVCELPDEDHKVGAPLFTVGLLTPSESRILDDEPQSKPRPQKNTNVAESACVQKGSASFCRTRRRAYRVRVHAARLA